MQSFDIFTKIEKTLPNNKADFLLTCSPKLEYNF